MIQHNTNEGSARERQEFFETLKGAPGITNVHFSQMPIPDHIPIHVVNTQLPRSRIALHSIIIDTILATDRSTQSYTTTAPPIGFDQYHSLCLAAHKSYG